MFEIIKKSLLTGVGLAVVTKDKVEEIAKDLIEKGKLSEKEGQALVDDLVKKSEQARKDLQAKIESAVQDAVGRLNVATKDDIGKILARIEQLEKTGKKGK